MGLFSKNNDANKKGPAALNEAKVPPLPPVPPRGSMPPVNSAPAPAAHPHIELPPLPADLTAPHANAAPSPRPAAVPTAPVSQSPMAAPANHPSLSSAPMPRERSQAPPQMHDDDPFMTGFGPAPARPPAQAHPSNNPQNPPAFHNPEHDDFPKVEVTKPEYFNPPGREINMRRKITHVKGPVFISLERYHEVKDLLSSLRQNSSDLRDKLESFKENKNEGNDLLKSTVENLETIEEDIENINSTLRV